MTTPADFARIYAELATWVWNGSDWVARRAPIINYLQVNLTPPMQRDLDARAAHARLRSLLPGATGIKNVNTVRTFNFNDYDYINNSITRCFMGKACPWEIQEMLQLASEVGAITEGTLANYCRDKLGTDCGGFVANYWGEACPHMTDVSPEGWMGIKPRNFWANSTVWSNAVGRRRTLASQVRPGDAAVFFDTVQNDNPDIAGSHGFHIALVNAANADDTNFTTLQIAQSSGRPAASAAAASAWSTPTSRPSERRRRRKANGPISRPSTATNASISSSRRAGGDRR